MKGIINILLCYFSVLYSTFCQGYSIQGVIKNALTKDNLTGAVVYIDELKTGVTSDSIGYFSILLPSGKYKVSISYLGFNKYSETVNVNKNIILNVELISADNSLQEVVVQSDPLKAKLAATQMSQYKLTMKEAKLVPALFGEIDILKVLQLKPGVQSGGEGSSGLYIRGGGADQNLILLDNATVYNASHLFGFFSIFNSDAVDEVNLYTGGFPAQYGGRLSSIVDVKFREGRKEKFSGSGGIGLISSRLTLETPLSKKISVIGSIRRTYADVFTRYINKRNEGKENYDLIPDYFFYDFNGKVVYELGKNDIISVTGYHGNDVFGFKDKSFKFSFIWGNNVLTSSWIHTFNKNLTATTSFTYSNYRYRNENKFDIFNFEVTSEVADFKGASDFNYFLGERHTIKFGASAVRHKFLIGRTKINSTDGAYDFNAGNLLYSSDFAAYLSDDFKISKALTFNTGLRLSGFYNKPDFYSGIEPRASAKFSITDNISLKGNYTRMFQYVHLVSNSAASLPLDIWIPSGKLVKPQVSDQVALGLSVLSRNNKILFTNELYYKWMNKQIDFKDGAQLFVAPQLDKEFVFGKGYSYGNEIYFEKREGKTTGWIGYTLSWSWRKFDDINNGKRYFPRNDRRNDVTIVLLHKLNKRFLLSSTWVYGTGSAITLPTGRYFLQDIPTLGPKLVPEITERNGYRMSPYHRLDVGVIYKFFRRWGESNLTLSVYNAYNRRNPYFLYISEVKNEKGATIKFQAKQVSLFPIIPSLTYNFKF